jgi:hypothetical protein
MEFASFLVLKENTINEHSTSGEGQAQTPRASLRIAFRLVSLRLNLNFSLKTGPVPVQETSCLFIIVLNTRRLTQSMQ